MSSSPEATPRKSSAAGRYFFMLLFGLVIGVIGTVMVIRSWQAKQDHFPDSVMTVQGWHMGQLKKNIEQNRCTANETIPHLQTLRRMADDIEPAFGEDAKDERFVQQLACQLRGKTIDRTQRRTQVMRDAMGDGRLRCAHARQ